MRYIVSDPRNIASDRFILSKGHAAPILYAAWAEAGLFPVSDLLNLRKLESDLEGHPTPRLNFIDVGTGSLGQGLSVAAGMAFVGKTYDKSNYRVYCLIGDGECAEGSIWEAINFAGFYKLNNLCAIIDVNRLGQSQATSLEYHTEIYQMRLKAFGWHVIVVDGHNVKQLVEAFHIAETVQDKPTALVAKTVKGKKFLKLENETNWHGKPLGDHTIEVLDFLNSLILNKGTIQLHPQKPLSNDIPVVNISNIRLSSLPAYTINELVATRVAYGTALAKISQNNPRVIAFDGDMKNSTYSDKIEAINTSKLVECFIAEQNLVSVAIGAACRDRIVAFVATFSAFLTRAFDQIRMGAISQTNINFVGSHCGVTVGEDGASQMGLEDIAMFRVIPGSTIFYPSDAVSCERAVELAANTKGICFIRTTRPATAIIYPNTENFQIGRAHIVKQCNTDKVLVIAAGVTLHEALNAAAELEKVGVNIRVMDPFTIKPLDQNAVIKHAKEVGGRIVTVEDHYPEGGLGEAVLSVVAQEKDIICKKMAITKIPHSGKASLLLDCYGISAKCIVNVVKSILE